MTESATWSGLLRDAAAEAAVLRAERRSVRVALGAARLGGRNDRLRLSVGCRGGLCRDAIPECVRQVRVRAVELGERLAAVVGSEVRVRLLAAAKHRCG